MTVVRDERWSIGIFVGYGDCAGDDLGLSFFDTLLQGEQDRTGRWTSRGGLIEALASLEKRNTGHRCTIMLARSDCSDCNINH